MVKVDRVTHPADDDQPSPADDAIGDAAEMESRIEQHDQEGKEKDLLPRMEQDGDDGGAGERNEEVSDEQGSSPACHLRQREIGQQDSGQEVLAIVEEGQVDDPRGVRVDDQLREERTAGDGDQQPSAPPSWVTDAQPFHQEWDQQVELDFDFERPGDAVENALALVEDPVQIGRTGQKMGEQL